MSHKPWEVHSALEKERLVTLANIIRTVRDGAVELHQPDEGDGYWSLGCRIYERTINAIHLESQNIPWLKVNRKNLYFLMLINGVPVRLHKGDIENPGFRVLRRLPLEVEAEQEQLAFSFFDPKWFWRIVVEPDLEMRVLRIVILQYSTSGDYRNLWEIPLSAPISTIAPVVHTPQEGIMLDEPQVSPKIDRTKKVASNEKE